MTVCHYLNYFWLSVCLSDCLTEWLTWLPEWTDQWMNAEWIKTTSMNSFTSINIPFCKVLVCLLIGGNCNSLFFYWYTITSLKELHFAYNQGKPSGSPVISLCISFRNNLWRHPALKPQPISSLPSTLHSVPADGQLKRQCLSVTHKYFTRRQPWI